MVTIELQGIEFRFSTATGSWTAGETTTAAGEWLTTLNRHYAGEVTRDDPLGLYWAGKVVTVHAARVISASAEPGAMGSAEEGDETVY